MQLRSRYERDFKIYDFCKEQATLDQIILTSDGKLIGKIYKFLLNWKMADEQVKETIVQWAKNFGYNIEKCQKLWTINYKMTMASSYKENLYKMFYRWHLPCLLYTSPSPRD